MTTNYQTLPIVDGTEIPGAFPTIEWFRKTLPYVEYKNRTLLDVGCCQGSFGIQALANGASSVTSIDSSTKRIEETIKNIGERFPGNPGKVIFARAEDFNPEQHDITVLSMIIHWLEEPEETIRKYVESTRERMVIIYRHKQQLQESGYIPSQEELDRLIASPPSHHEFLSETPEQNIKMAIYDTGPR
jgi:16S rRNA G966 N2-methylase RsmD